MTDRATGEDGAFWEGCEHMLFVSMPYHLAQSLKDPLNVINEQDLRR